MTLGVYVQGEQYKGGGGGHKLEGQTEMDISDLNLVFK